MYKSIVLGRALINKTTQYVNNYINSDYKNFEKINRDREIDHSIYSKVSYFLYQPTLILDSEHNEKQVKLYIGSAFNAYDYYLLQELDINSIINATAEVSNYFPDYFDYLNIPINDDNYTSIKDHFSKIETFFYKMISENKGNILIHCYQGASRSAAVILFIMTNIMGYNYKDAYNIMIEKREIINLNKIFSEEIKLYIREKTLS